MANTKVTQHVIANNAITADQIASAAVTDAKLHSTLDLSGKTLTLPATAIPSASTATTQSASDNSTKLATTAYVTTAIANLNDSAPTALNTLNELAAALGDDANFSATITTALGTKLPLAGGTLTGALTLSGAPTSALHAATKTYVDTADALKLNLSGGTLTGDLILNTTGALKIPVGTTGQRPTAATGQIRWNSTDGAIEVYNGTAWTAVGTGSSNKVLDTFTGDNSNRTFTLSVTPANEDAIMVFIDGAYQEKGDYVLTNNSLVLDTAPLAAEKIAVHTTTASVHDGTSAVNNQFTATAGQTAFTLTQDPSSENNTQVYINGVYQQKTDYTVVGTTLTFDTGLTVGDVVEVNMFTVATLGNTDTVTEGVGNLYHTTARARGAISVSGNAISYNSSTGVLTSNFEENPTFTSNVNITGDLDVGAADGNNAVMKLSANTGNWVFTNVQSNRNLEISDSDGTGTVLTIDTSGKVGIAEGGVRYASRFSVGKPHTHTPGSAFTNSPSSFYSEVQLGGTTGNDQKLVTFAGTDASNVSGLALYRYRRATGTNWTTDGFSLRQEVDNTENIYNYINFAGGKVGIGTVDPQRELHVHNSSSGATPTSNSVAVFEGNDNTEISILGGSSSILAINFGHSGDNSEGLIYFNTTTGSENMQLQSTKDITYQVTSTNSTAGHHIFKSHNTEIMRIDGANNRVGINGSPGSPLTVKPSGSIGDGANIADFIGSDANQRLIVANFACGSDEDRVGFIWENQGVALWRNWMDDDGHLRLKSSNPTHDHDGARVVTESLVTGTSGGFLEQERVYPGNVANYTGDVEGGSNKGGTQIWIFSIQGNNNWYKVLTNMHDMTFEMYTTVGDAGSRDQASYSVNMTSPAYGVSSLNQNYYHNGGWNTGSFEYRYVATPSNNTQYDLECRFTSYYSSSNVATGYIHMRRVY